jgi:flagellar biosynthetic protein FlhB
MAEEKTEKPTAKKLKEAIANGDLLQSKELSTAMVVMAGVAALAITGPQFVSAVREMLREGLSIQPSDIASFSPEKRFMHLVQWILVPLGTILGTTFLAAIAGPLVLGSLGFRTSALGFKFNKLNPASGLKRIFGIGGFVELVKSLAKVLLLGSVGTWLMWDRLIQIRQMGKMGIVPALDEVGSLFIVVALGLAGSLFLVAGIDVPAQIFQRAKRLSMTKHEVKDEHKQQEGAPEAKQAMRRKAMEAATGPVRKAVQEASVILTNPTHFAVALRYRPGFDEAPVVLARGHDEIARIIRECAAEASVPVLQYPELTRAIYYTSKVGHVIDDRLFLAVATVLAFVFRIETRMASEMDRPHVDLPDDVRFDADGRRIILN